MLRIGITGANGMLGKDLQLQLNNMNYKVLPFSKPEYDITQENSQSEIVNNSDIIVNCAAYTAVKEAEYEKQLSYKINADAVKNLGALAQERGKHLIHISTDFVFGNNNSTPNKESTPTNPLNVYGKSKLEGENLLNKVNQNHSIIRVQWTYGKHKENFISKLIKLAKTNDTLKVVKDQFGAPTYTKEIAKAIIDFIEKRPVGVFHFAEKGYTNRFQVAKFVLNHLNFSNKIIPCKTSEFGDNVERPLNSRFDCRKIEKILSFKRKEWESSLKEYLATSFK